MVFAMKKIRQLVLLELVLLEAGSTIKVRSDCQVTLTLDRDLSKVTEPAMKQE